MKKYRVTAEFNMSAHEAGKFIKCFGGFVQCVLGVFIADCVVPALM